MPKSTFYNLSDEKKSRVFAAAVNIDCLNSIREYPVSRPKQTAD